MAEVDWWGRENCSVVAPTFLACVVLGMMGTGEAAAEGFDGEVGLHPGDEGGSAGCWIVRAGAQGEARLGPGQGILRISVWLALWVLLGSLRVQSKARRRVMKLKGTLSSEK